MKYSEFYRIKATKSKHLWKQTRDGKYLSHLHPFCIPRSSNLGPWEGNHNFYLKTSQGGPFVFPFLSSKITAAIFFYRQLFIVFFSQIPGQKEAGQKAFQQPHYFVALFKTIKYNQKRKKKSPKLVQLIIFSIWSVLLKAVKAKQIFSSWSQYGRRCGGEEPLKCSHSYSETKTAPKEDTGYNRVGPDFSPVSHNASISQTLQHILEQLGCP